MILKIYFNNSVSLKNGKVEAFDTQRLIKHDYNTRKAV
jgi:hypothetical protein